MSTPRLFLDSTTLFRDRIRIVRDHLKTIVPQRANLEVRAQASDGVQIISASDNYSRDESPRDRLFRTASPLLHGQYFEIWRGDKSGSGFFLYQYYFHLYSLPSRNDRDQLFCLHAEPQEKVGTLSERVKALPHFHMVCKEDRLQSMSKAHLPACHSLASVIETWDSFNATLKETLQIIRSEILDRYK